MKIIAKEIQGHPVVIEITHEDVYKVKVIVSYGDDDLTWSISGDSESALDKIDSLGGIDSIVKNLIKVGDSLHD